MRACSGSSVSNVTTERAIPSMSSGAWRHPETPSSTTSDNPPTREATTGTPHAIASSAARPKLSCADGSRKTSDDGQERDDRVLFTEHDNVLRDAERAREPLDLSEIGAVADQQQA